MRQRGGDGAPPVWSVASPVNAAAWDSASATPAPGVPSRGSASAVRSIAWRSAASAKGSAVPDSSPSMVCDSVCSAAMRSTGTGVASRNAGLRNSARVRVLGSNIGSRRRVSGSITAVPTLTEAVLGVVCTTKTGHFGFSRRGLITRPPSVRVARSRNGASSARPMAIARAETTAEPPPKARMPSTPASRAMSTPSVTLGTVLCGVTRSKTRWSMPVRELCSRASPSGSRASVAPQQISMRVTPSRTTTSASRFRHLVPAKIRTAEKVWE